MPTIENIGQTDFLSGNFKTNPKNAIVIRIAYPNCSFDIPNWDDSVVFRTEFFNFDDIECAFMEDEGKKGINPKQASQIVSTLVMAQKLNMNVIVHCAVGISRSGAIVEFAVTHLGFTGVHNDRIPNKFVVDELVSMHKLMIG